MGIKIAGDWLTQEAELAIKLLEDERWEWEAQRSLPWWMRLHVYGWSQMAVQIALHVGFNLFDPRDGFNWPGYVLFSAGSVAVALWAAGKVRLRNTRRWLALQRAVGVDP